MNTEHPHDILPDKAVAALPPRKAGNYFPVTPDEEEQLRELSIEQRRDWIAQNITPAERLARLLEVHECAAWVVYNARHGRYDGFELHKGKGDRAPELAALVTDLKLVNRYALARRLHLERGFDALSPTVPDGP